MEPEYREGATARKDFEQTMQKLFKVPKTEVKPKPTKKEDRQK